MTDKLSPFMIIFSCFSISLPSFAGAKCSVSYVDSLGKEIGIIDMAVSEVSEKLDHLSEQMKDLGLEISRTKRRNDKARGILKDMQLAKLLQRSRSIAEKMNLFRSQRNELMDSKNLLMDRMNRCIRKLAVARWEHMLSLVRSNRYSEAGEEMEMIRSLEEQAFSLEDSVSSMEYPTISEDLLKEGLYSYDDKHLVLDMIHDFIDKVARDSIGAFAKLNEVDEGIKLKKELLAIMNESSNAAVDGGAFFSDFDEDELRLEISTMEAKKLKLLERLEAAREALKYYEKYEGLLKDSLKDD